MVKKTHKVKKQPTEWKNIFVNYIPDKWLIPRTYKELLPLNNKYKNNMIKKHAKNLYGHFSKEDV